MTGHYPDLPLLFAAIPLSPISGNLFSVPQIKALFRFSAIPTFHSRSSTLTGCSSQVGTLFWTYLIQASRFPLLHFTVYTAAKIILSSYVILMLRILQWFPSAWSFCLPYLNMKLIYNLSPTYISNLLLCKAPTFQPNRITYFISHTCLMFTIFSHVNFRKLLKYPAKYW